MKPALIVTNHVPPDRAGAFAALARRTPIELALFGGRSHHATGGVAELELPHRRVRQRDAFGLAASGRYRAVMCGTAGRVALPAAWLGARRGRVPFVLWSALWAPLHTPAHVAARPLMALIYRDADAVIAYGPHVAEFAQARGARRVLLAPQAVDNDFWAAGERAPRTPGDPVRFVFVGRDAPEKGLHVLLAAWRLAQLRDPPAELVLVGGGLPAVPEATVTGQLDALELRNLLARCDVLVVPSIATRGFREPWGLVANEAMNQRLAVIASDAVGAVAGGLVVHERNGLVVGADDPRALADALRRLHGDAPLRARLGDAGAADVAGYTYAAWADGVLAGLEAASAGRRGC